MRGSNPWSGKGVAKSAGSFELAFCDDEAEVGLTAVGCDSVVTRHRINTVSKMSTAEDAVRECC